MSTSRKIAILVAIAFLILVVVRRMTPSAPILGHKSGVLQPLPDSPNCVSSQTDQASKQLPTLPWTGDVSDTLDRLAELSEQAGGVVTERTDVYLRVEFRTRLMGYTDDVEWLVVDQQVHFRSASRVGYWDLGVNRRRMQKLSQLYLDSLPPAEDA